MESKGLIANETSSAKKLKNRGKKRKRSSSASSTEADDGLPANSLLLEKNLHISAAKNNLDDASIKKILKKVVTNDHVLALVKLREEEERESKAEDRTNLKLTRSKVKELMKVSPKSAPWNLEKLELTPIKHIPVKTRPEVKALIAQELPEDEDDDEYQPTHDDVPSDDDQTLETCSDVDSQPRTPATPRTPKSIPSSSPKVVKDGPFKVPQNISTPARRKLELEAEEATIALRTRSKLSLSETPIEHIESSFVPPDDLPTPVVDDLWNQFLKECLNPDPSSKHEDDDEADPEYNVAADPDANDEDEEALENSIVKISKKELSDLVTELFSILPETTDEQLATSLGAELLENQPETLQSTLPPTHWEGKQEPISDEENSEIVAAQIKIERRISTTRFSIGKTEPGEMPETGEYEQVSTENRTTQEKTASELKSGRSGVVEMSMCEKAASVSVASDEAAAPACLRAVQPETQEVHLVIQQPLKLLPEQSQIVEQQLRMHVQLSACNYLQLYVNPAHWKYAPVYKEYLEAFNKLVNENPKSIANVCNLKPAIELITSWEKSVSERTPENIAMVEFVKKEAERCRRRSAQNNLYLGEFPETLMQVVANSSVFLYPYLLPSMPYKPDVTRRFSYVPAEDELIALGMEQFWQYIDDNPGLFRPPGAAHPRRRWGLGATVQLISKHMLPWLSSKTLMQHVQRVRKQADINNPIYKFLETRKISPVRHKLLEFNPKLTLYEQPEHEIPRIWVRYLAKTSKRFKDHNNRRSASIRVGRPPEGVEVGTPTDIADKQPLPIDFTKPIICNRLNLLPSVTPKSKIPDRYDVQINNAEETTIYQVVETSTGSYLVSMDPEKLITTQSEVATVANNLPENSGTDANVVESNPNENKVENEKLKERGPHCECCLLMQKICKQRQTVITDYFSKDKSKRKCYCSERKVYPKVSNRLRLLVNRYKTSSYCAFKELQHKLDQAKAEVGGVEERAIEESSTISDLNDLDAAISYQMRLTIRTNVARDNLLKRKVNTLFSNFNPNKNNPVKLAEAMFKIFDVELVDMYKEFVGFLTAEQADELNRFSDYFTQNCAAELIRKVEEQVSDKNRRCTILSEISRYFSNACESACEICTSLLLTMEGYPKLAAYVFSLFPHKRKRSEQKPDEPKEGNPELSKEGSSETALETEDSTPAETPLVINEEQTAVDYEADNSSSGEEENGTEKRPSTEAKVIPDSIKQCLKFEEQPPKNEVDTPELTITKTEVQDYDSSDASMVIMSEDETMKSEPPEWTRDEDKMLLEVLKQSSTPEERKDKTILELVEEKEVFQTLCESFTDKSISDIRERIMYLLEILVQSER